MNTKKRVILAASIVGIGLVLQAASLGYLKSAGPLPSVALKKSLAEFPMTLGKWQSKDLELTKDENYTDEHFKRAYYDPTTRNAALEFSMTYSSDGSDRGHHPEVCMANAGLPENPGARAQVEVDGSEVPVQRFLFGKSGEYILVYYWHYTLKPALNEETSQLQRLYQRLQRRPSSVTLQVFARYTDESDAEKFDQFIRDADAEFQKMLPEGAVRGNRRLPVTVFRRDNVTE